MQVRTKERIVKQPIFPKTQKEEPKIINLAVHLERLTAQLTDGRELSIPIDWFAKWGVKGVNAEKLRKYEIKVKKITGRVSEEEQNETERIVKKNKDLFLAEWKKSQSGQINNPLPLNTKKQK